MLHDAATVARRIIQLPDRRVDVGAMMMRQMVWQMHQRVGDGGAIAAVLAKAVLDEATRMVAAGAVPVLVQQGIEAAAVQAVAALNGMSQAASSDEDLANVARAVTGHEQMSFLLGEMFDILGLQAHITVEKYVAPYFERKYIEGGKWKADIASPGMINAEVAGRGIIKDAWICLYDGQIKDSDRLIPLLRLVSEQKEPNLLLVTPSIENDATTFLAQANAQANSKMKIICSKLYIGGHKGREELSDLALLTGATVLGPMFGRTLDSVKLADLGRAKRVEAGKRELFVIEGNGDRKALREEIEAMEIKLGETSPDDEDYKDMQRRLARFSGSSGVLQIGAHTKPERDVLYEKAQHAIKALSATMAEGFLPGGGVAYLHAAEAITIPDDAAWDVQMGYRTMKIALEQPFLRILSNAGIEAAGVVMADVKAAGPRFVYDVVKKEILPAYDAGVLDPTQVLRLALESAASSAAMALSVDVTVLKKKPRMRKKIDP